jgi:hypothetical protein
MSDGRPNEIGSDAFKFASWSIRRIVHLVSGRKFGSLALDEQVGTAVHAVFTANEPMVGPGIRIGAAATGAAWRAICDIARSLNIADLEIGTITGTPDIEHDNEHSASQVSESERNVD